MNIKLMFKNSWKKMRNNFKILGIFFVFIIFAFSLVFGLFNLVNNLRNKFVVEPFRTGQRIDGQVTKWNYSFFSDDQSDDKLNSAYDDLFVQYVNNELKNSNENIPSISKQDDIDFLKELTNVWGVLPYLSEDTYNKYKEVIDVLSKTQNGTYGNVFQDFILSLISNKGIMTNLYSSIGPFTYNNREVFMVGESQKEVHKLQNITYHKQFESEEGYLNIYAANPRIYKELKNKKLVFTIGSNQGSKLKVKVVGYSEDTTNIINIKDMVFNFNSDEFEKLDDFKVDGNKKVQNLCFTNLFLSDSKSDKFSATRINQILRDVTKTVPGPTVGKKYIDVNESGFVFYTYYKQSYSIYFVLCFSLIAFILTLTLLVVYFVLKQMISNDRKILFYLKYIGLSKGELSLINLFDILFPIVFAFILSIPLSFVVHAALFGAINHDLNFPLGFFQATNMYIVVTTAVFIFLIVMFYLLILINISSKALNKDSINSISRTEKALNKVKPFMKKVFGVRSNVVLSIANKNFYPNVVTLVVTALAVGITLFGSLFISSSNALINSYKTYYPSYDNRTTYNSDTDYISEDDKDHFKYFKYEEGGFENNLNNEIIVANNGDISFTDESGKKLEIKISDNSTWDNAEIVFNDVENRFLKKTSVKNLLENIEKYKNVDNDEIKKLVEIAKDINSKISEIKNQYPTYNGSSLAFNTLYSNGNNNLKYTSINVTHQNLKNNHYDSEELRAVDDNYIRNSGLYNNKIAANESYNENVTLEYKDYKTDDQVKEHLINLDDKTRTYSTDFFTYFKIFSDGHGIDEDRKIKISVPIVDAIDSTMLKYKDSCVYVPLFSYKDDSNVLRTFKLPVYLNIVKNDKWNPDRTLVVNKNSLYDALKKEYDDALNGMKMYFGSRSTDSIMKHFVSLKEEIINGKLLERNNTVYSKGLPRGLQDVVLVPESNPSKISSYSLYKNGSLALPMQIDDFRIISQVMSQKLSPIKSVIKIISYLLGMISFLISVLLIYLLIKENWNIIKTLKIMGYRNRKIISYMVYGYLLSVVFGSGASVGVSFLMFYIFVNTFTKIYNLSLAPVFAPGYFVTLILIPIVFITFVMIFIFMSSSKIKINSIDDAY